MRMSLDTPNLSNVETFNFSRSGAMRRIITFAGSNLLLLIFLCELLTVTSFHKFIEDNYGYKEKILATNISRLWPIWLLKFLVLGNP